MKNGQQRVIVSSAGRTLSFLNSLFGPWGSCFTMGISLGGPLQKQLYLGVLVRTWETCNRLITRGKCNRYMVGVRPPTLLHTQEVTGSSPVAPTIQINKLQTADAKIAHPVAHPDQVAA